MARRQSPLLEVHTDLGAKLTDFGGWQMPLHYSGVVAEHNAVRNSVGVFDVSHLGKLRLEGDGAEPALQEALTTDVARLEIGRASYSLVLNERGGCIDDVFVYRLDSDVYLVVPNAANVNRVAAAIRSSGATTADEWDRWAILALQGPDSFGLFNSVFPDREATDLPLHAWCSLEVEGHEGFVARTGYTGERGFELYLPAAAAAGVWRRLLDGGAAAAGLGARDTLRLEMGYALYGHELTEDINPLEAGLGWTLGWDTNFRGRRALEKVRAEGPARRLFGVKCRERGVPRAGNEVVRGGTQVGTLTSGNFSPTLGAGIGLGLGPSSEQPTAGVAVEVVTRTRRIRGDIVKPPFIKHASR